MNNEYALQIINIQKNFGTKIAVDDVSFNVKKGEIFGLLGPNGAGKTTIIKMITTLLNQDHGQILINGFDSRTQARLARSQFSVTGQTASIDQDLTARENLIIFSRLNGLTTPEAKKRATELLTAFDLVNSADQPVAAFSGGMRRRLDLAVSLVGKPSILFLDEPTTGLDPRTRLQMWQAIQDLVSAGSTILLTTQYLEEAEQLADRIALIDHGQLTAMGTPNELKRQVGGQQLLIQLTDDKDANSVQAILQSTLSLPVQTDSTKLTVLLEDENLSSIPTILTELQKASISINKFSIETPSLDDVFMQLTVGKN